MGGLLSDDGPFGLLNEDQERMQGLLGRTLGRMPGGRLIIEDEDGIHTELSATRPVPGLGWVNFPTIFNGQRISEDQAFDIVSKNGFVDPETGRQLSAYQSQDEAVKNAIARSESLNGPLSDVLGGGLPSINGLLGKARRR